MLDRDQIVVQPGHNPRSDATEEIAGLAQSIKHLGLLTPLRVGPTETEGVYALVAGHRRLLAIDSLIVEHPELNPIPVLVAENPANDKIDAIVENVQRVDLNPVDEAEGYRSLIEAGWTITGIAQQSGVSKGTVTSRLDLLSFPEPIIEHYRAERLPLSTRKPIAKMVAVSVALAIRAAERCAGKEHWAGVLAKSPGEIVERLCDDDKEAVFRVGGQWTYDRIKALRTPEAKALSQKLADLEVPDHMRWIAFSQEEADQIAAAGVGYVYGADSGGNQRIATTDVAMLLVKLTSGVAELEEKARAQRARRAEEALREKEKGKGAKSSSYETGGEDSPSSEEVEAKKAARAAALQARKEARGRNLDLGRLVATSAASMPMSTDVMRVLVLHLLAFMDTGQQGQAGLRLCFEAYQTENDGRILYKGMTKGEARQLAGEWVLAATSAEELLGRAISLLLMGEFADQGALAPSNQIEPRIAALAVPDLYAIAERLGVSPLLIEGAKARAEHKGPNGGVLRQRFNLAGSPHATVDWQGNAVDDYGHSAADDDEKDDANPE